MISRISKYRAGLLGLAATALVIASCGGGTPTADTTADTSTAPTADTAADTTSGSELSGEVIIDGSSTVAPISKAVAEEFAAVNPGVKVPVGTSGSGGGFKKFCAGDTDISNASRPIKDKEIEVCNQAGIEFIELPVAIDGLTVVVNQENEWASCLTPDDLKKIWEPDADGTVTTWADVRDGFPDEPLILYAPGADSGTFDYFTEAIVGEEDASRTDYQPSEDDNIIVQGVLGDTGAMGYFGVAYYEENADSLKAVAIDNGSGCVAPTAENINTGKYAPLSRPLFVYVNKASLEKPEVKAFVDFYIENKSDLVREVGYVDMPEATVAKIKARVNEGKTGSTFSGAETGVSIDELLDQDL
ncbi:phosphate ABC transporter substrate-binding protein, PhoT family [Thalassoporum mexicanum PCC 7367]|uniref:PstS family phosphate ABC transporter substrate-binding protein n=1 Tax=Thalassoporum mexicanum TaxID=3457544 RepID=UPI00029F8A7E|nr:PstS family phosphate ABC transporter substrate-binding protein [Pseudanabaena sp. PCC 7367]AFY69689.1 phosphate ABC transporter substrate-binding protein, PhoT family [Pseudanabaena sp. PCC 7367]